MVSLPSFFASYDMDVSDQIGGAGVLVSVMISVIGRGGELNTFAVW